MSVALRVTELALMGGHVVSTTLLKEAEEQAREEETTPQAGLPA